jgi:hypothetical protein
MTLTHARPRTLALAVLALGLLLPVLNAPAQAAPKASLQFANGRLVKNCQLMDVVGDFIAYKCQGQQQVTTQRIALAHPFDTLTTKQGKAVVGQVTFTDTWTLELKTPEGLQKLRKWGIKNLALGSVASMASTPSQGTLLGGAAPLTPADNNDAWPADEMPLPLGNADDAPLPPPTLAPDAPADPTTPPEQEPTPEPTAEKPAKVKKAKKVRTKKEPIRRLITPTISPDRIDKPYDGLDRVY